MIGDTALHAAFTGHAETIGARLVALHALLTAGALSREDFIDQAALLVGAAQARMFALADAALAAWLTAHTAAAVPALGVAPPASALPRLRDGLAALLAVVDEEDPEGRVLRFGRSETAGAFQDGYGAAMMERPEVAGYRRVLNVQACELCRWHYRDGYVWPARRRFARHPGCGCHPEPVLRGG